MPANTADDTSASPIFSIFISLSSVIAAVPEVVGAIAARRRADARRDLVALGRARLVAGERERGVAADDQRAEHGHDGGALREPRARHEWAIGWAIGRSVAGAWWLSRHRSPIPCR